MSRLAARLAAPLALVAVAVVVLVIVTDNVGSGHHQRAAVASQGAVHPRGRLRPRRVRSAAVYTVRSGDSLSAIATRTRVPIARLVTLNPRLTPPYSLRAGERLRLGP